MFDNEIYEIRQELKNYFINKAKIQDEIERDNFFLDNDLDINSETQKDLVLNIDMLSMI
jgi:hypothetical protein